MTFPLMALAVGAIVAGFVGIPAAIGGSNEIERFLEPSFTPSHVERAAGDLRPNDVVAGSDLERGKTANGEVKALEHAGGAVEESGEHVSRAEEIGLMLLSLGIAISGILLARKFYVTSPEISTDLAERFAGAHTVLSNKYYVDEFYDATVISGTFAAGQGLWAVDRNVVDGAVNGTSWITVIAAWFSGLTDRSVVDGLVNLVGAHRAGIESRLETDSDRPRAELRAPDALRHLRVRQRLSVRAVTMNHYLSLILFTPLAGALLLLLVNKQNENAIRWIANTVAFIGFVISVPLWFWFNPQQVRFPVRRARALDSVDRRRISSRRRRPQHAPDPADDDDGVHRDPVVVERHHTSASKEYYIFLLVLQTGMLGAFMSLDFLLFFLFWEVMLVPMYFLIGIWGSANRLYSAIKFFLYTLVGSVIMLLGILALYFYDAQRHRRLQLRRHDVPQAEHPPTTCSGGCSWRSSSASRSRCRCSRSTPGCPTRTPTRRPPAR